MSNERQQAPAPRERVTFEVDRDVLDTLRGIARAEHRTLAAQLRVICEDHVANMETQR